MGGQRTLSESPKMCSRRPSVRPWSRACREHIRLVAELMPASREYHFHWQMTWRKSKVRVLHDELAPNCNFVLHEQRIVLRHAGADLVAYSYANGLVWGYYTVTTAAKAAAISALCQSMG
jgi:hypothetical protein